MKICLDFTSANHQYEDNPLVKGCGITFIRARLKKVQIFPLIFGLNWKVFLKSWGSNYTCHAPERNAAFLYSSFYLLLLYQILKITLIRQPKCFCLSLSPWPILVPPCIQQWSSKTDWYLSEPPPGSHSIGSPTYWLAPLNIEKWMETLWEEIY